MVLYISLGDTKQARYIAAKLLFVCPASTLGISHAILI